MAQPNTVASGDDHNALRAEYMYNQLQCRLLVLVAALLLPVSTAFAQETAPYPNGTSGLKAGSVPLPGKYWLMYNRLYETDNSIGPHGEAAVDGLGNPIDLDLTVYANVHRFIYSTDYEVFGAKYAWNFVIPLVAVDVNLTNYGINETEFRIADFNIEPIVIEWHEPRYDFGYVYGLFAPTAGRNDARPAIPGKAHWTNYVGAAGTYYFDDERTWAASILSRYEIASKRDDKDIRPGDNFSFEWGLSRNFDKTLEIGVSGYCSWQLTLDKGSDVTYTNVRDRVYGIGPEINYFSPKLNLGYNLRYWWEFEAVDRPQGTIACLTIVKPY